MKQTYENYFKNYYHLNKETIKKRSRKYKKKYNEMYYNKNKDIINAKRKEKRDRLKFQKEHPQLELLISESGD